MMLNTLETIPDGAEPLQRDTFVVEDGVVRLLASRCNDCGGVFFPVRHFCGRCCSDDLAQITLSAAGQVNAYSLIDRKSALSLIEPPYMQASVRMAEGVNVYTILTGLEPDSVAIGQRVETALAQVGTNEQGAPLVAFVFRPQPEGELA